MPTDFLSPPSPVVTGGIFHSVASATGRSTLTREFLLVPSLRKEGVTNIVIPAGLSQVGSGDDCLIRLTNTGIAPLHAVLDYQNDRLTLKSVDYRVWLNDSPVKSTGVRAGDRITFGPAEFLVHERLRESIVEAFAATAPAMQTIALPITPDLETTEKVRENVQRDLTKTVEQLAAYTSPIAPALPAAPLVTSPVFDHSGPLKREIARLVDELDEQKKDVLSVRDRLRQSEAVVQEVQANRAALEDQLALLTEQKAQTDVSLTDLREEIRLTVERLTTESLDASQSVQRLRDELAEKEELLIEAQKSFEEQKTQWEQSTTGLESELALLASKLTQVEGEWASGQKASSVELSSKIAEISDLHTEVETLRAELDEAQKSRTDSDTNSRSAQDHLNTEISRLSELLSTAGLALSKTENSFREQLTALEDEAKEHRQLIALLTSEKSVMQTELESNRAQFDEQLMNLDVDRQTLLSDRESIQASREELNKFETQLQSKQAAWEIEKANIHDAIHVREEKLAEESCLLNKQSLKDAARTEELDRLTEQLNKQKSELEGQLAQLDEKKTEFDQSVLAHEKEVAIRKEELETLSEQLEVEKQSLTGLQAEFDVEKADHEQQVLGLTSDRDRLMSLQTQLSDERSALNAARLEIEEQSNSLAIQREEIEHLNQEVESRKSSVDVFEQQLKTARDEHDAMAKELSSERAQLKNLKAELESEHELLKSARIKTDVQARELLNQRNEIDDLTRELEVRRASLDASQDELNAAKSVHQTLCLGLTTDRDNLQSLESQLVDERAVLQSARIAHEEQAVALIEQREELNELTRQLKLRQAQLKEIQGVIAEERAAFQLERDEFELVKQKSADYSQQTIETLEVQLADAQELITSQKNEFTLYQELAVNDQKSLHSQLDEMSNQLAEYRNVRDELEGQLATFRNEITTKEAEFESSILDQEAIKRELDLIGNQQSDLDYQAEILDRRNEELNVREEGLADQERTWLFEQRNQLKKLEEREVEVSTALESLFYQQQLLDELRKELDAHTAELNEQRDLLEEAFQQIQQPQEVTIGSAYFPEKQEASDEAVLGDQIWQNLQATFQEDAPAIEKPVVDENVDLGEIMATPLKPVVAVTAEPAPSSDNRVRSLLAEMFGMGANSAQQATDRVDEKIDSEEISAEENPFADMTKPFTEPVEETHVEQNDESAEDSIASYMEKLLSRTRGHQKSDANEHKKSTTKPLATPESHKLTPPATKKKETTTVQESSAIEEQRVVRERLPIDKDATREGIHKLRALANRSARTAVANHTWKQVRVGMVVNMALATICFVLSLVLGSTHFWAEQSYLTYSALSGLIGLVSAGQVYRLSQITKQVKSSSEDEEVVVE